MPALLQVRLDPVDQFFVRVMAVAEKDAEGQEGLWVRQLPVCGTNPERTHMSERLTTLRARPRVAVFS